MEIKESNLRGNRFSGFIENGNYLSAKVVSESWVGGFIDKVASDSATTGLRSPQFGALCAIRANWTINKNALTVVMPTGTGKTETMLATIVAEKILRTLIVVPSDFLRTQIYEKACHWGVLLDIGNLRETVLKPNVLLLKKGIKDSQTFRSAVESANIIITTMSLVNNMNEDYKKYLAEICSLLIVDEAHHISSKTWRTFKSYFKRNRVLQFTATPFRSDGNKIDGDIVYNFPLALAQKHGYFEEIEFAPVEEFDENKKDNVIAQKAVQVLERDLDNGLQHILLVRAKSIKRARELYENIYSRRYLQYNPVLVESKMSLREKRENLEAICSLNSHIVVCVDMFGEGVDIPNLKIVAIHDKYKSIPITLQFIGRFARTRKDLGHATIVTNIADDEIVEAIEDMYEKDTDWNKLLPLKYSEFIEREIVLQNLVNHFDGAAKDIINLKQMRPKVSMIAYHTKDETWNWGKWVKVFDESTCCCMDNQDDKILVVIEPRESSVRWSTQQNISDLMWNFYVVYWNQDKNVVFLNASDKYKGYALVSKIFRSGVTVIKSEQVFRCLYGINRLALVTVGLNSGIDGPIRYKMFAGIDVAKGISESTKNNCYKSNIFGIGYNGNGKVSIGCSYKGVIWSKWVESLAFWKNWCDEIIDKILDESINVKEIMDGVLIPEIIKNLPSQEPYRIDWPDVLNFKINKKIVLSNLEGDYPIEELDIALIVQSQDNLLFEVKNDFFKETFSLEIGADGYRITSKGPCHSKIRIGNQTSLDLDSYFNENPPTIWYVDCSSIQGNVRINLSKEPGGEFPASSVVKWDWGAKGVNIRTESQLEKHNYTKKTESIQYALISEMRENGVYSIVFDDDGPGEIADVIGIREQERTVRIDLFHCKFSSEDTPGARLLDLYEVCGQAEKSVKWRGKAVEMIGRMENRERKRLKESKPSRFEVGDISKLHKIKNKLFIQKTEMFITIVQPGVDSSLLTSEMHSLLVASQAFCMDTYSVPLRLICS